MVLLLLCTMLEPHSPVPMEHYCEGSKALFLSREREKSSLSAQRFLQSALRTSFASSKRIGGFFAASSRSVIDLFWGGAPILFPFFSMTWRVGELWCDCVWVRAVSGALDWGDWSKTGGWGVTFGENYDRIHFSGLAVSLIDPCADDEDMRSQKGSEEDSIKRTFKFMMMKESETVVATCSGKYLCGLERVGGWRRRKGV